MAGNINITQMHAGRELHNVPDPLIYWGSFELDGDDNDPVNVRGEGFTVTHSGDNDYLISFARKPTMMVACLLTPESNAAGSANADDLSAVNEPYVANSGQLIVRVSVGQVKSDAEDGQRINFMVVFHETDALSITYA